MRRSVRITIWAVLAPVVLLGPGSTGRAADSGPAVTVLDTLPPATPDTRFSVFGSGAQVVSNRQLVGPRFTLTEATTVTEIGAFLNNCARITERVPECPDTRPLTVQIRPARDGLPDPTIVLASFPLTHDDDPLVFSYEYARPGVTLPAGTYFALFAPQGDDVGHLLGTASDPFRYQPATVALGFFDPVTGNAAAGSLPAAVRILGIVANAPPPACTRTATGDTAASIVVGPGEHLCLDGARVAGSVTVRPGGSLTMTASKVAEGVIAEGAAAVRICGSDIAGGVAIRDSSGPVTVGDPTAGCAANRITSPGVSLIGNTGGVTLGGNVVHGTIDCSGNLPSPTNGGETNTVLGGGTKLGQCALL